MVVDFMLSLLAWMFLLAVLFVPLAAVVLFFAEVFRVAGQGRRLNRRVRFSLGRLFVMLTALCLTLASCRLWGWECLLLAPFIWMACELAAYIMREWACESVSCRRHILLAGERSAAKKKWWLRPWPNRGVPYSIGRDFTVHSDDGQ